MYYNKIFDKDIIKIEKYTIEKRFIKRKTRSNNKEQMLYQYAKFGTCRSSVVDELFFLFFFFHPNLFLFFHIRFNVHRSLFEIPISKEKLQ